MREYSPSGSPFVRGGMDSYYRRPRSPHCYVPGKNDLGFDCQVRVEDLTEEEVKQYYAGFEENEDMGDYKDWG
jgi:hypothetical protein